MKGHFKPHTEESKLKNRLAHLGKKSSEETKRKIGLALLGGKRSDKTKKILSEGKLGNKNPMFGKPSWNTGKRKREDRYCLICNNPFSPKKESSKLCSKECANKKLFGHKFCLGMKHTEETKLKHSQALKGKIPKNLETLHKTPWTEERKMNAHLKQVGEKASNWKGGISPLVHLIRRCFKYRQWVSDIFFRDNFTCQKCGQHGGVLHAHHSIKEFAVIFRENNITTLEQALDCEEFWNLNNGITLCRKCHLDLHKKYGK